MQNIAISFDRWLLPLKLKTILPLQATNSTILVPRDSTWTVQSKNQANNTGAITVLITHTMRIIPKEHIV